MFVRAGLIGLGVLVVTPATSEAQAASYLVTGVTFEVPKRDSTTSSGAEKVAIGGVNLGVGFPLARSASLEFAGVWHSAETDVDRDGKPTFSEYRVRNRDFPLVAGIRFQPFCPDRWCAEINGGFGINFSRRAIAKIGECGTLPNGPCVPSQGTVTDVNKEEFTLYFGTSVTVVVANRMEIGPTLRLWYVNRYRDELNPINVARTPGNERLEVGFTAVWHFRR